MKTKKDLINLYIIFLLIISLLINIDIVYASLGTSSNNKLRLNTNYYSFEQNTSSNFLRGFSKYLQFNTSTSNFYSRFGILNLRPSIPIINSPTNDSYLKSTNPELNWSNSTDPEEFSHILYILELSDNINFQYFNYSNNSIRETNNVKIGRASCRE